MIIKVGPLSVGGGGGGGGSVAVEYDYVPTDGQTIIIPESSALLINVLLWPAAPINDFQLILPPLVTGRRVFIFANEQVAQMTVTSAEIDTKVANNVASMNMNDLIVFNAVSTASKIWARVATS